jgi:hypothetical protein
MGGGGKEGGVGREIKLAGHRIGMTSGKNYFVMSSKYPDKKPRYEIQIYRAIVPQSFLKDVEYM